MKYAHSNSPVLPVLVLVAFVGLFFGVFSEGVQTSGGVYELDANVTLFRVLLLEAFVGL
tara:strand:+ start:209 stop:385 length:177 start_codon:yes stop_codon:yes gene_type:complete